MSDARIQETFANSAKTVRIFPAADVEVGRAIEAGVCTMSDSLQAIPVSGEGRSTRERIATPFMKDLKFDLLAFRAYLKDMKCVNSNGQWKSAEQYIYSDNLTIICMRLYMLNVWAEHAGGAFLSIPAFLQDDEPFEDARSVHFSAEALKYRLEGKKSVANTLLFTGTQEGADMNIQFNWWLQERRGV